MEVKNKDVLIKMNDLMTTYLQNEVHKYFPRYNSLQELKENFEKLEKVKNYLGEIKNFVDDKVCKTAEEKEYIISEETEIKKDPTLSALSNLSEAVSSLQDTINNQLVDSDETNDIIDEKEPNKLDVSQSYKEYHGYEKQFLKKYDIKLRKLSDEQILHLLNLMLSYKVVILISGEIADNQILRYFVENDKITKEEIEQALFEK